ncbi:hypothetical protein KIH39_07885 [Telmatocola sphagniphila]|uniref:Uncharacterized protein n=1 Tax=Telmatocola sphagniphila TaxID=1123043 RepID=A0A8E6BBC4_9BACT|nr:hypothetical protein [Telmatocola sphagniphila]QVL33815.1 hypothetical protein KIH39_07885 [Telmatocola sphagniphila]
MRNAKFWILSVCFATALTGTAFLAGSSNSISAEPREDLKDHWRNHDGHWSYWNEADKQWYYTDGVHWFFSTGKGWELYRFDKKFGHEGFEHGTYKVPTPEVKVVVPRHEVWHR